MVLLFNTTYFSVDLAHHQIFRAKFGKGGIIAGAALQTTDFFCIEKWRLYN